MNNFLCLPNGISMPMIGFGTYRINGKKCENAVYDAISSGYRLIDTASMYENEEFVGNALSRCFEENIVNRNDMFITTKLWTNSYSYNDAIRSFYNSLEKLRIDYIDLYLLHNSFGYIYEAWEAITELYNRKIIRAIGISNFSIERIIEFMHFAELPPMVNQIEIHPYYNQASLVEHLKNVNCVPQAWAPLAEGKYNIFEDKLLSTIALKHKKKVSQIILKWNIQRGIPVITQTTDHIHLLQNIDMDNFELSNEEITCITSLTKSNCNIINYNDPDTIKKILNKNIF